MFKPSPLALGVLSALSALAGHAADSPATLPEVLVTAPQMRSPLTLDVDTQSPFLPRPAMDGADLMKSIPGFSVIRKGGTGGDPLLRGLGVSRLPISVDGSFVMGGCGGRMDPPTAYIYPAAYDSLRLTKGPQIVTEGPVPITGLVRFERKTERFTEPGVRAEASAIGGSFGRQDTHLDLTAGSTLGYVRFMAQEIDQNDYKDGQGATVHSRTGRRSETVIAGLTPDADTLIELSADRSRGFGAYADRTMDGTQFDRDAFGVKLERRNLAPWLSKLAATYNYSYVDHVMDNYTLRPVSGMKMLSNPDREVEGGKVQADVVWGAFTAKVGVDFQNDWHTLRTGVDYRQKARANDLNFSQHGIFGEAQYAISPQQRVLAGVRFDRVEAKDDRVVSATSGKTLTRDLTGGFVRGEWDVENATWFVGVGHAERAPDYWEASRNFTARSEANTQLDAGVLWKAGTLEAGASVFASKMRDFLLYTSSTTVANIDATRFGGEADLVWKFAKNWRASASVSAVQGNNDTANKPLAQTPPLETRLGLAYDDGRFGGAVSVRAASRQNRVDIGAGTVAGLDAGPAAGFVTLGLNGAWRPTKSLTLSAGVDNLLNKTYAESVSKAGALVSGYQQTVRINEPGRTFWLKGAWML